MNKREEIAAWIEDRCDVITDLCNDLRNGTENPEFSELGPTIRDCCNEIIAYTYLPRH